MYLRMEPIELLLALSLHEDHVHAGRLFFHVYESLPLRLRANEEIGLQIANQLIELGL